MYYKNLETMIARVLEKVFRYLLDNPFFIHNLDPHYGTSSRLRLLIQMVKRPQGCLDGGDGVWCLAREEVGTGLCR